MVCSVCFKDIDKSNYVLIYNAKEVIHFHLFKLTPNQLSGVTNFNINQFSKKGSNFNENTKLGDIDTGVLNKILIERDYYMTPIDISITSLFNFDGVDTKRDSNEYTSSTPIFLVNNNLPIEIRFKKPYLMLIGLYTGKKKLSASFFDPFTREINSTFNPWYIDIRDSTYCIRNTVLGSTIDGMEIPRLLNIFSHKSKYFCHECDLVGDTQYNTTYFHRFSQGRDIDSARITREYRDCLLQRLGTNFDTMVFKGRSNYIDYLNSFYPMSTVFCDSLHIVYEGIEETILQSLKYLFPSNYQQLIEITEKLILPRTDLKSSINTKIDGVMHGNDMKFFLFHHGVECLLLVGFPKENVENFEDFRDIIRELDGKENEITVSEVLELYKRALIWTKNYAKLYTELKVTSKVHKYLFLKNYNINQ